MKTKRIFLLFFIAASAFSSISAQSSSSIGERQVRTPLDSIFATEELNQVVVTGTRTPKLLTKSPVLTEVIGRSQIEKSDATDLRDLLQQVMPGVEFSYAMNQQVHMNFSGFGGQSMLVLVDSERLAGETMDDVDFSRLLMNNVDHVEIIRGAASALYGSNATGGVINIITKDKTKKFGLNVNRRVARHDSQRRGVTLENGGKKWGNTLSVTRNSSDNYNVTSADNPVSRVVSTIYGDKTWDFSDRVTYKPIDKLSLSGHAGYYFRELTRTADAPERYRDMNGGLKAIWNITGKQKLEGNYNFDQYDKSDYQKITKLDVRDYSNVQNSFRLLYTLTTGSGTLTAGADYLHDYLYNDKINGETRRQDSFDAFSQYDWDISPKMELVGALRYDYFSDGNTQRVTPRLNLRYEPIHNLNFRLGYGLGFRAPTLKEKYYNFDMAGIWIVDGNPDLKPEVSRNSNVSVEYTHGHYNFNLAFNYNRVKNKIGTGAPYFPSTDGNMPHLPYINLANYNVTGVQATVQGRWNNGISARVAYTYTHEQLPKSKEGERMNNQYIPARSHALNGHIDWSHRFGSFYGLDLGLDGRFLSSVDNAEFIDYYDVSKGTVLVHYPAYTLFKLSTAHVLGKKQAIKLTVAVDNLFNYKPKYYYLNCPLTDGANLMVGLSIDIDKLF